MAPADKPPEQHSVLVIEDDAHICRLIKAILGHHGYVVDVAESYAAGTAAVERLQPSLIILDLGLPDGDGLDLLRWLREDLHRGDPVLVLTAFRQGEKSTCAFELGANDFMTKPFALSAIIEHIERIVHGKVPARR